MFKATFEEVSMSEAESAFKAYLKNYKAKVSPVKGASNEYQIEEVKLSDVNQGVTSMHVKFTEVEGNASMYVNYVLDGKMVSRENTPDEFEGYLNFTNSIADKGVYYAYDELINAQEGVIKSLEKELKSFEKDEVKEMKI